MQEEYGEGWGETDRRGREKEQIWEQIGTEHIQQAGCTEMLPQLYGDSQKGASCSRVVFRKLVVITLKGTAPLS